MKIDHELPVEPGQAYVVDAFRPEDALGVASLFFSIYGPEYPFETFYVPERLIAENANGNIYSVVARTAKGDIIGHSALYRSSPPNPALYEAGQSLVLQTYRTTFAAYKMNRYITEVVVPRVPLCGFFTEPVCHHETAQKNSQKAGAKETALELGLMPAESYAKDAGTTERVSCLFCYRSVRDQSQRVYVPPVYEQALAFCAADLGLDRESGAAAGSPPADGLSQIDSRFFRFAGVGRCQVTALGADFPTRVADLEKQAALEQAVVLQLFLNLNQPAVGVAVDHLRTRGFCLGGYLPRWFDSDGLLMQKLRFRPAFDALQLYSERARGLLQIVRQDWELTHR